MALTLCCVAPAGAQAPAVWRVDAKPIMASAGADAIEAAELLNVRGAIRLGSGHVVVANGSPATLKVFGPKGAFLRTLGRPGGGPGEFRGTVDVHRWAGDTILAISGYGARHTLFRLDGTVVREWTATAAGRHRAIAVYQSAMLRLPLGGLTACARSALDAQPRPVGGAVREVLAAGAGRFWIRTIDERDWHVVGHDGRRLANVSLPPRFDPYQVDADLVLGRQFDDDDIEQVVVYRLAGAGGSVRPPACDGVPDSFSATVTAATEEMRAGVRNLLTAGEMFYANQARYPRTMAELARFYEGPRGTDTAILSSSTRGLAAGITHRESGETCLIAIGTTVLAGWPDGEIRCGG